MSVVSWLQSIAKTKFLWRLLKLNQRISEIVADYPKKYRANYGDHLINIALKAMTCAQVGNSIFMHPGLSDMEYNTRRDYLRRAKGYTDSIATVAYVFLELTATVDGVNRGKILRQEEEIGLECREISKMIDGVLDNDRKIRNSRQSRQA